MIVLGDSARVETGVEHPLVHLSLSDTLGKTRNPSAWAIIFQVIGSKQTRWSP